MNRLGRGRLGIRRLDWFRLDVFDLCVSALVTANTGGGGAAATSIFAARPLDLRQILALRSRWRSP